MNIPFDTIIENEYARLEPLHSEDFEKMFEIASDPAVWEQHPCYDRYKKEVFEEFFQVAIDSKSAYKIFDKKSNSWAGCTRFYDYDEADESICIGYTFYATRFWGKGLNHKVKNTMLHYIFPYVKKVYLHVGCENKRSQIAVERLGAHRVVEKEKTDDLGTPFHHYVYQVDKPMG